MKIIEVDEELYQYIAGQTQSIGESASDILRRLLNLSSSTISQSPLDLTEVEVIEQTIEPTATEQSAVEISPVLQHKQTKAEQSPLFSSENDFVALRNLLDSADFQQETKAVNRFLAILSELYQSNNAAFAEAINSEAVQGRTRVYFAQNEETLLNSGNHTKPKEIPQSPYWVITNNNSGRKMIMLEGVMREMKLPETLINDVKDSFVGG